MSATPLIHLESAQVSIQNVEVLRGLSLRIAPGQLVGLIGLVVLAVVTAVEATLAVQRARRS